MKPEWHIAWTEDGCYKAGVKGAKEREKYIKAAISKEDIGHLLQGKHVTLLFLDDDYRQKSMLDIGLTDNITSFEVSDRLNDLIVTNSNNVGQHGHWTLLDECSNAGVYCSVCHKKVYKTDYANQKIKSKYCPNCGSIMDEEFEKL